LNQPGGRVAFIDATALRAKAIQCRQRSPKGYPIDCACVIVDCACVIVGPAASGCPVQVPVRSLKQPTGRRRAIGAVRVGAVATKAV
jgi:hypothetical protein